MNPWGLMLVGFGIIVFIIGFKGSQHNVVAEFKQAGTAKKAAAAA